jgi:glycosidase
MVYSLMFSLPGTPVLFYGEELGMGENLAAGSRLAVRTPMQWTDGPSGGFTTSDKPVREVVTGGYSPEHVNASEQRHDPDSLLAFMRTLVTRYRASAEMGWGEFSVLKHDQPAVLAHSLVGVEGHMIALHNFSGEPATVTFPVAGGTPEHQVVDLLVDGVVLRVENGSVTLAMDGYGYRWFRVIGPGDKRLG